MRRVAMGFFVLIITITASFVLLGSNSDKSASIKTDEATENAIAKSMRETHNEKKKIEELLTKTSQELKDNGYPEIGLSFSPDEWMLTVQAPNQEIIENGKRKIEEIIFNNAKEINLEDFEVNYMTLDHYVTLSEEDEKLRESTFKVADVISELLSVKGYHYTSTISTHPNQEIEIVIEGTKEDLKNKDEFKKLIANTIFSKTNMKFDVKIRTKSENEIRDQEWQPIFESIMAETQKEFEEYRGFAYSFHPEPLQIIIKTNIDKPNKRVKQITKYVDKVIELKREELLIEDIPYKIIIRNKNDEKIN